jgi:catalase (peroxidase I)
MAKYAALTVRKLKEGSYDDWRKAWWDPNAQKWPEGSERAYILRNVNDPNEVIAFGFFEGDLTALRDDPEFREMQRKRFEAMAPHVESTGADGIYEVVEVVEPS